jgi:hypothetical protein
MFLKEKFKYFNFFFPLYKVKKKKIYFYFFLYLSIIIISSITYGYHLNLNHKIYDENYNIIFKNISFSNGELIHNLFYNNQYYTKHNNIIFFLQKTPAIPFLIFFLSLLSKNFFFIICIKNLIIFSLYFILAYKIIVATQKTFLFFILISITPIIIPYNFGVSLNFFYEDCLIAILLPLTFLLVITKYKHKYLLIGLIFFILYFVKTSMVFLIIILPILTIFLEKKSVGKLIPVITVSLAIFIWGFYGLYKSGKFSFLSSSSSFNTHVMSYALNSSFNKYYPNKSTDLIPINYKLPDNIKTEWEFYDFYKKKNNEYLKKNINRYLKDLLIKLKFIFFGINRDGSLPDDNGKFNNDIRISQILSKIFLNLSILLAVFNVIENKKNFLKQKKEIYFIFMIVLNLFPHILVWATSKHLVGITNVSIIYLIYFLFENKKFKNAMSC